jgi:hypothetical protein
MPGAMLSRDNEVVKPGIKQRIFNGLKDFPDTPAFVREWIWRT